MLKVAHNVVHSALAPLVSLAAREPRILQGMCGLHTASLNPLGMPAFSFDIDGVLIRGTHVIPAAREAIEKLCPSGVWRYPVVFMTNGGGVTEGRKAEQLSDWLQVPVHADQVILSHTPMKSLASRLGHKPVLISGRGDITQVAASYGFTKALTTQQLWRSLPTATPFAKPPSDPLHPAADPALGTEAAPLAAVLVLNDPANWYVDAQLIIDVIGGRGVPTRREPTPGTPPVEVYFSNPDLLWANEFSRARFGQGAFAHLVLGLYREMTGAAAPDFPLKFYGKPNREPYQLAEQLLQRQALRILGAAPEPKPEQAPASQPAPPHPPSSHALYTTQHPAPPATHAKHAHGAPASSHHTQHTSPTASEPAHSQTKVTFSGIYAVGDNPAADVRGANAAGTPWVSVLVKTGVFQGPGNCSKDAAAVVVDDVLGAVNAALHRTRSLRFHSMR